MSRYFDVDPTKVDVTATTPTAKQRRIKKRKELRLQKNLVRNTVKIATSEPAFRTPLEKQDVGLPVDEKRIQYYSRGEGITPKAEMKTQYHKEKLLRREKKIEWATRQSAKMEILLTEDSGYLVAEDGEKTTGITQTEIEKSVDVTSAAKHFDLHLNFGPYRSKFIRNGRHLLLGGRKGHVAAFDWITKKLHCEMNVMEEVFDIQWLHQETMFAVAQKKWLHIYDNTGIELHCLKGIYKPLRLDYLPYHFLLTSASEEGYLTWLDISIGSIVSQFNCKLGRISMMTQNPYNAILCTGHAKGTVCMWSPNVKFPVAKMLCHRTALSSLAVDSKGVYMATSGVDRIMNIWDIRNLNGPLQKYRLHSVPSSMSFSQKSFLALALNNVVEVYNDCCTTAAKHPYLRHRVYESISNVQFCPFEDVLGIGHYSGYSSILVPGSGEPNMDALECNPFETKNQRKEAEVKALLEKIQPEMITLDPLEIIDVNVPSLKEKVEARNALIHLKPSKIDFTPRRKKRRINVSKVKEIVRMENKKEMIEMKKQLNVQNKDTRKSKNNQSEPDIFDRFK